MNAMDVQKEKEVRSMNANEKNKHISFVLFQFFAKCAKGKAKKENQQFENDDSDNSIMNRTESHY